MNSRQLRRQRHAIKMAKTGLRKFGKSMGWLMMQESPLTQYLRKKGIAPIDGGTSIEQPFIYNNCNGIGIRNEKPWDGSVSLDS